MKKYKGNLDNLIDNLEKTLKDINTSKITIPKANVINRTASNILKTIDLRIKLNKK